MGTASKKSGTERVREYRERMRAKGLRPVQVWLPDTSSEEFIRQAREQAKAVAHSANEKADISFADSLTEDLLKE